MNWIWWVLGYIVIGWITSILHMRFDNDFGDAPVELFGALWFAVAIVYIIKFVFFWVPDKIDDGLRWIEDRGYKR